MKSALPILLLLAAAPVAAIAARHPAASPPAPAAPISKDGLEITVAPMITKAGGPGAVTEVGLDLEAKSAEAAARFGFQSLRAVADVDCAKMENRFVSAEAFDQPALAGPARTRSVTGQWVQPTADSYMAAVIARVCAPPTAGTRTPETRTAETRSAGSGRLPVVREMAAAPPPAAGPAPPPSAVPAAAAPAAAAPAAEAAAAPPPSPPLVVKFNGGRPTASPPAHAAPPAAAPSPADTSPAAAAPAAAPSAPSGPLVVKFSGAGSQGASSAPAAAPSAPSYIPHKAGERIAQVSASPSQQQAEKVLRQLRPLVGPPLTTTIEQAQVGAAHVWRADVVGFASAADAKAFCRAAAHVSKTCWVRAKSDGPKPQATPLRGPQPAPPRPAPVPKRAR